MFNRTQYIFRCPELRALHCKSAQINLLCPLCLGFCLPLLFGQYLRLVSVSCAGRIFPWQCAMW